MPANSYSCLDLGFIVEATIDGKTQRFITCESIKTLIRKGIPCNGGFLMPWNTIPNVFNITSNLNETCLFEPDNNKVQIVNCSNKDEILTLDLSETDKYKFLDGSITPSDSSYLYCYEIDFPQRSIERPYGYVSSTAITRLKLIPENPAIFKVIVYADSQIEINDQKGQVCTAFSMLVKYNFIVGTKKVVTVNNCDTPLTTEISPFKEAIIIPNNLLFKIGAVTKNYSVREIRKIRFCGSYSLMVWLTIRFHKKE